MLGEQVSPGAFRELQYQAQNSDPGGEEDCLAQGTHRFPQFEQELLSRARHATGDPAFELEDEELHVSRVDLPRKLEIIRLGPGPVPVLGFTCGD